MILYNVTWDSNFTSKKRNDFQLKRGKWCWCCVYFLLQKANRWRDIDTRCRNLSGFSHYSEILGHYSYLYGNCFVFSEGNRFGYWNHRSNNNDCWMTHIMKTVAFFFGLWFRQIALSEHIAQVAPNVSSEPAKTVGFCHQNLDSNRLLNVINEKHLLIQSMEPIDWIVSVSFSIGEKKL